MSSPRGGRVLGVQFISMPTVRLDALQISDWDSFHSVFATSFGFPSFYGRNMNAWIDCMTYLDADDGMTTVHGSAADPVVIRLDNARTMPKELFDALVECAGFVNLRRLELGEPAMLMLAFHR